MTSRVPTAVGHVGWTALYVGLVLLGASAVFAAGAPTQGCYPGCVGTVEPTVAIAGLCALFAGLGLAAIERLAS